jgi:hypothetical protein
MMAIYLMMFYVPILIVALLFYIIENPRRVIRSCKECIPYIYKGIKSFILGNVYSDVMSMMNINDR